MPKPFVSHDEFVACALEIQRNFDVEAATTEHIEQTADELNKRLQNLLPIGSTVLARSAQLHCYTKLPDNSPTDEVWTDQLLGDSIAPIPHTVEAVQGRYDGISIVRTIDVGRNDDKDTVVLGYTLYDDEAIPTTGLDFSLYFSPIDATIVTHVDPKSASTLQTELTDTLDAMLALPYVDFAALATIYKTLNMRDRIAYIDYLNSKDLEEIVSSVRSSLVIARHVSGEVDKMPHMANGTYYDNDHVTTVPLTQRTYFGHFSLEREDVLCVISPHTPVYQFVLACSHISGYTMP